MSTSGSYPRVAGAPSPAPSPSPPFMSTTNGHHLHPYPAIAHHPSHTQHQTLGPKRRPSADETSPTMTQIHTQQTQQSHVHTQISMNRRRGDNNTNNNNNNNNSNSLPHSYPSNQSSSGNNSPKLPPSNSASRLRSSPIPHHHKSSSVHGYNGIDADDGSDSEGEENDSRRVRGMSKPSFQRSLWPLFSRLCIFSILKYIVLFLLLFFLSQYLYHMYLDRHKATHYSIVGIVRDLTYLTSQTDKMRHAFTYTALMSWSQLVAGQNIIIFADTRDTCTYVSTLIRNVQCILLTCWHDESHKPLLSCIFATLSSIVTTPNIVYVNGDLSLHPSISTAIEVTSKKYTRFLLAGERVTVEVKSGLLDEYQAADFQTALFIQAKQKGKKVDDHKVDVFVFPFTLLQSSIFTPFPPFLAGVYRWDQWLLSSCILDDTITVIDMTPSVLIVQQERVQPIPPSRLGTAYNDQLVKTLSGNSFKIGNVANAEMSLIGLCPQCEIIVNTNITDVVLFTKRASKEGYLVILTVNSGYTNLALNWVCWAKRIHFHNYILIAEDQLSASKFRSHGCPVIVRPDAPAEKPAADYGSIEFQETMTFRTEFLYSVLIAGFHFVTADMDGLWLDDPIQYFNHNVDLQGQTHKETKISGGFVVVRATSYGRYFWQQVIECQRGNAAFLSKAAKTKEKYEPATYTEQYCVNELSHGLSSQPLFSKGLLDPYIFPDGRSFFDEHLPQYHGISPAVIHNNWIKGTGPKLARLHDWHLHSADEEKEICVEIQALPPPVVEPSVPIIVRIKVLAHSNPAYLLALLTTLASVDYHGDTIHMDIHVDRDITSATSAETYKELKKIVHDYTWNYGTLTVKEPEQRIGHEQQWLRGWISGSSSTTSRFDQEVLLVLEEDVSVSPQFYDVLRVLLQRVYANPKQYYDHRLFGISLTRPNVIIGENHQQRWGSKIPSDLLPPSSMTSLLYKYQLLSTSAVVLFPHHFHEFVVWMEEKQKDKTYLPCVPTLISNEWYQQDRDTHWFGWWHRYVFEQGWYSLYLNLPDSEALTTVVHEYGQHVMTLKHRTSQATLIRNVSSLLYSLETLSSSAIQSIPVYDFHMKQANIADTLSWRQYLTPPRFFTDQCWTLSQLEAKLAADAQRIDREKVDKVKAQMEKVKQIEAEKKAKMEADKKKKEDVKKGKDKGSHPALTIATAAGETHSNKTATVSHAAATDSTTKQISKDKDKDKNQKEKTDKKDKKPTDKQGKTKTPDKESKKAAAPKLDKAAAPAANEKQSKPAAPNESEKQDKAVPDAAAPAATEQKK